MALIKCPKCGKVFSEHATQCPECGTSIIEIQSINAQKRRQANKKIVLWSSIIIVVGVIIILANWERIQERLEWAEYYEWYYGTYKK